MSSPPESSFKKNYQTENFALLGGILFFHYLKNRILIPKSESHIRKNQLKNSGKAGKKYTKHYKYLEEPRHY